MLEKVNLQLKLSRDEYRFVMPVLQQSRGQVPSSGYGLRENNRCLLYPIRYN